MNFCMRFMPLAILLLAGPAGADSFALVGGKLHTVADRSTIDSGTVLVEDGVITAIGSDVDIPANTRTIDVSGKVVTPGLFGAYTHLGLVEISQVEGSVDAMQSGTDFAAGFDIADAVNPRSSLIGFNRSEGVTRALVAPVPGEEGDVLAGLGALIHLGDTETYLLMRRAALFVHLGEGGSKLAGGSRALALLRLENALADAGDFDDNRLAYEHGERREYSLSHADLEALQPVLDGDIPLVAEVHRVSDIEAVLRLARRFGLRLVILGGEEAWLVADKLAAANVAVLVDPLRNLPASFARLNATLENAARLHKAGVTIAIVEGRSHNVSNITQSAGNAVAHGLPWDAALAAITLSAAKIFGQDGVSGSLEPGKDADIVIWDGDPLEVTSYADQVFIRGIEVPAVSRQILLRERYRDLDQALPPAYRN